MQVTYSNLRVWRRRDASKHSVDSGTAAKGSIDAGFAARHGALSRIAVRDDELALDLAPLLAVDVDRNSRVYMRALALLQALAPS